MNVVIRTTGGKFDHEEYARGYSQQWRLGNPGYGPASSRKWRKDNPNRASILGRIKTLKQYGLTIYTWMRLFNDQDCRCACCGVDRPGSKRGWHTDHDHAKKLGDFNFVRGILCAQCNVAIGQYESSRRKLIEKYLAKFEDDQWLSAYY